MNLAFVLLSNAKLPPAASILEAHHGSFPDHALTVEECDGDSLVFKTESGLTVHAALMAHPVPNGEADAMLQFSVAENPDGLEQLVAGHRAHLVVATETSEEDPLTALAEHTRALAAVASAAEAIAIYDGLARATHPVEFFASLAGEESPIALWTGVSVGRESAKVLSFVSLGMGRFGLPNLVVAAPPDKADDAFSFLFDLCQYVLDNGAFDPGDTVGHPDDEELELPITSVPSPLYPSETVLRVELGS